jgi:hypothetical protein
MTYVRLGVTSIAASRGRVRPGGEAPAPAAVASVRCRSGVPLTLYAPGLGKSWSMSNNCRRVGDGTGAGAGGVCCAAGAAAGGGGWLMGADWVSALARRSAADHLVVQQ